MELWRGRAIGQKSEKRERTHGHNVVIAEWGWVEMGEGTGSMNGKNKEGNV